MTKIFPIGYIECINCHRPAVWLVDSVKYIPKEDTVSVSTNYKLVNYNPKFTEEETLYCDNCECLLDDSNLISTYVYFLDAPGAEYDN